MLLFSKFQYISDGLTLAMSGENTSLLARFAHWDAALNEFYLSPIFGLGPGKGTMTTIVDGEYFLLLRRYGILGTMIICYTIFMMPFWQPNRTKPKSDKWIVLNYSIKYFSLVIFFTMITNSFFSGYQLFLPYDFLCTVSYRYAQQTEKQR
jgi:O-antigen ligase